MAYMQQAPLLLACAILLSAAPVLADPSPGKPHLTLRFEYSRGPGAESCPTEHPVHDLLMGALGYDPVKPDAGPRVQIAVTRRRPGFHAEITIYDGAGKVVWVQELDEERRCMDLVRPAVAAAASMAAIYLPRPAPATPAAAPPTPSLAPPPRPAPPPAAPAVAPPVRVVPAAPPSEPLTFRTGIGPIVNFGIAPGVAMGALGVVTVHLGNFALDLELKGVASVAANRENGHFLRGQFFGGALVPCFQARPFFLCGALNLGYLRGSGDHLAQVKTDGPVVIAVGPRLAAEKDIVERLLLHGFIELTPIVTETDFVVDEKNVWKTPPLCVSVGGSIVFDL